MHVAGHEYSLLSSAETEIIHRNVLRILAEVGIQIENQALLKDLEAFGLQVDLQAERVYFPSRTVEHFLERFEKFNWQNASPRVSGSAGVYHGRFHDPESNDLTAWTESDLAYYFRLARRLEHLEGALMLGCRLPVPPSLEPLYERYYCWKYGALEGSSIYLDALCPYLYELYQIRAAELGKPLSEVFRATVYLIPALRLGRHEAYQVQWFRERGLRVHIGDMLALGANAPVTLAGGVALNLAEQIGLRILELAWFGDTRLHIGGSISPIDLRTMIYQYGRPEMAIANLMLAQMARYYGASYSGHAALTDAKLPSVEAGYQKALTGIPTLLACGSLWMDAGLLSIDEICSPIQLILDNEFLSALKRFTIEYEVSDESISIETILSAGPAGQYLDKDHTVRYMRSQLWQPRLWSREMLGPWLDGPRRIDADRAREIALQIRKEPPPPPELSDFHEKEIQKLIEKARADLQSGD